MTHAGPTQFTAAKAIVGAIAAGVVTGLGAAATGLADDMMLNPLEWVLIASAAITGTGVTGWAVYRTTNKPKL